MTAVEQAIRDRLVHAPPVSSRIASRIYPRVLPQTPTLPAVVYQRLTTTPTHSHDGASDLDMSRLQLDVWADTYAEAREAAIAIRTTLDGERGMWSGMWISAVLLDSADDFFEDATRMWRQRTDWRVWHATEVP